MSTHSRCMKAPCTLPCFVKFRLICNGETFWVSCNFVKKLEKVCGLVFVHVCGEDQLCNFKISACSEGSPWVFWGVQVGRSWKTDILVFKVEDFIWLSTMWMVHYFDVIVLMVERRGTMHFDIWKGSSGIDVSELSTTDTGRQTMLTKSLVKKCQSLRWV